MSAQVQQNETGETVKPAKKGGRVARVFKISGVLLLLLILVVLIVNALLTLFNDNYYTTFGKYRLFAIVTDSMEPAIPTGSMIVSTKPISDSEIAEGTVITFKFKSGNETILLTHRVVEVTVTSQGIEYTTRGDNAGGNDTGKRTFDDIVGIYTGNKCGFFGSLFGFLQSALGVSMLIFFLFVVIVAWIVIWYVNRTEIQRSLNREALKKSAQTLSNVNLRHDNIHEITAVMDVLGMVTETPRSREEEKEIAKRLNAFIHADNSETAAGLDTLSVPDNTGSLAAAFNTEQSLNASVSTPEPCDRAESDMTDETGKDKAEEISLQITEEKNAPNVDAQNEFEETSHGYDRRAYAQYRELSAQLELKQAEQLRELLYDAAPLNYEEQIKVAEYKAAIAKPKTPRKPKTSEQIAAAKERAAKRKHEREAFLNELSDEDRELYLTEEKLAKSRSATIRRLKRIAADRKLLEKIDE